jgi:hypothetical protein
MANITLDNHHAPQKKILPVMELEGSLDIPVRNFLLCQHFEQPSLPGWFFPDGEHIVNMRLLPHENGSQHSPPKG